MLAKRQVYPANGAEPLPTWGQRTTQLGPAPWICPCLFCWAQLGLSLFSLQLSGTFSVLFLLIPSQQFPSPFSQCVWSPVKEQEPQQPSQNYCLENYKEFTCLGCLWAGTLRLGATFKTNSYFALIPSTDSFLLHWHGFNWARCVPSTDSSP